MEDQIEAPFTFDEGFTATPEELDTLSLEFSNLVYTSIQNASNGTARTAQQLDYRLGVSNLGHCRNFARLMTLQTPFSDVRDKTAAFFGTVSSEPIEAQVLVDNPDYMIQSTLVVQLPSGAKIPGHSDIIIPSWAATPTRPQGIVDLKSKAELETIKKMGRSQQQQFQLDGYAAAAVDAGYLDPALPIYLTNTFYDRSGKDQVPYSITTLYDPLSIQTIDDWVADVMYAVLNNEEASKDMPREWCNSYCEYATVCRGNDTDVQGLIEDPEVIAAVQVYTDATKAEGVAKEAKAAVKSVLEGVNGSTGTHVVRQVEIGESEVSYTRAAYTKLDIRPVTKKK